MDRPQLMFGFTKDNKPQYSSVLETLSQQKGGGGGYGDTGHRSRASQAPENYPAQILHCTSGVRTLFCVRGNLMRS
ncbi:hypothetical protein KVR01_005255 [Diaporthe batatas]|uniref:uncharacterized protein n=1 Tax=Diaporthe batatas TaxID=748121 RepID=UPI001D03ECFB|nr:uncharacterized protein KVR01_005255 [Diaporthe batatas]KAG8164980.1 hypothetical protein KVR01_005255 [Diaporthe batatas]